MVIDETQLQQVTIYTVEVVVVLHIHLDELDEPDEMLELLELQIPMVLVERDEQERLGQHQLAVAVVVVLDSIR